MDSHCEFKAAGSANTSLQVKDRDHPRMEDVVGAYWCCACLYENLIVQYNEHHLLTQLVCQKCEKVFCKFCTHSDIITPLTDLGSYQSAPAIQLSRVPSACGVDKHSGLHLMFWNIGTSSVSAKLVETVEVSSGGISKLGSPTTGC